MADSGMVYTWDGKWYLTTEPNPATSARQILERAGIEWGEDQLRAWSELADWCDEIIDDPDTPSVATGGSDE